MSEGYEIRILNAAPTEIGPQAEALLVEPNGDAHRVRCLCRLDETTEIGEPENNRMMEYLTNRYGCQLVTELREAICNAC
jgi:hypothetical protein